MIQNIFGRMIEPLNTSSKLQNLVYTDFKLGKRKCRGIGKKIAPRWGTVLKPGIVVGLKLVS